MFVKNILHISGVDISDSKRCYNVIPSVHYFYRKTNMFADFQIYISVPLNRSPNFGINKKFAELKNHIQHQLLIHKIIHHSV